METEFQLDEYGLPESPSDVSSPEPQDLHAENVQLSNLVPTSMLSNSNKNKNPNTNTNTNTNINININSLNNTINKQNVSTPANNIGTSEYYQAAANYISQKQSQESNGSIIPTSNDKRTVQSDPSSLKIKLYLKNIKQNKNIENIRIHQSPKQNDNPIRDNTNDNENDQIQEDDFSDDVSIGEIERGIIKSVDNGPDNDTVEKNVNNDNKRNVTIMKTANNFEIKVKFSDKKKMHSLIENVNSVVKPVLKPVSKPATKTTKSAKVKPPKAKKRPRHPYSRYMVKYAELTNAEIANRILQKQLASGYYDNSKQMYNMNQSVLMKGMLDVPLTPENASLLMQQPLYGGMVDEIKHRQYLYYQQEAQWAKNQKKKLALEMRNGVNVKPSGNIDNDKDDEDEDEDDGIVEKYVRISLKDPLSGSKIETPLRSRLCSHVECFDYDSFLAMYNLRPFKIAIRRFTEVPAKVGEVDVNKLLEDTKRIVIDSQEYNRETKEFKYKAKLKNLKEKHKKLNELEWFCCPICKLEFNIKNMGDVYIDGEFLDMLQDLKFEENSETIEDIEIDLSNKGKWRWIREDENEEMYKKLNAPPSTSVTTGNIESNKDNSTYNTISKNTHQIDIVTLDSDSDSDTDKDKDKYKGKDREVEKQTGNANNNNEEENDLLAELDTLFEENIGVSTSSKNVAPATTNYKNASMNSNSTITPTPSQNSANSTFITHGILRNGSDKHRGVVAFRPGAFISSSLSEPPPMGNFLHQRVLNSTVQTNAPVFMTGEGAEDDPIVLD